MNNIIISAKLNNRRRYSIALTLIVLLAGCNGSWRPSLEHIKQTQKTKELTLADYLKAIAMVQEPTLDEDSIISFHSWHKLDKRK